MPSRDAVPPIVCLSPIDWDFLWQQQQILMAGFAARGAQVAFVEKLDAGRNVRVHDWRRILGRARGLWRQRAAGDRYERQVRIVTPAVLPSRVTGALNRWITLPRLAQRLRRDGFGAPVVWTYSAKPNAALLERLLSPRLLIYHCVNRLRGYRYATQEMIRAEDALVRRADLVIADARILWEEKRVENPHCVQLPPGVEFALFAEEPGRPEPERLRPLPRPRVGFFGNIDERLDEGTLATLAELHPSWSVVLIGPVAVGLPRLKACANVTFVGAVPHEELGAWLQALDVLVIPYRTGEFTRGVLPAKLYESLATGKPVVCTGLAELVAFEGMVRCCDASDFTAAVERAWLTDTADERAKRVAFARANSWDSRVDQAWEWIAEAWGRVRQGDGRSVACL